MDKIKIAVLGAGSWGTALAIRLATNGHSVKLCCYDKDQLEIMDKDRTNKQYLPDIVFPNNISVHPFTPESILDCDYCLIAVPSVAFAKTIENFKEPLLKLGHVFWATKGFDAGSGKLLSEFVDNLFPDDFKSAVLTGPSFAKEVGKGLPTAVSIASTNLSYAKAVQDLFHCPVFRSYICDDVIGAQIGGALKNVIAISTGVSDGLEYGANSRAALITRGLAEIQRLGLKYGAKAQTFMGLTGMGDLVLTCTDNQSRNRRFGLYLGQGHSQDEAFEKIQQVVEGHETVKTAYKLAQKYKIEMPITKAIYQMLYEGVAAKDAVINLLSRQAKSEF